MRICIVYNAHPTGCSFYRLEMPNAYLGDNYTEFDYVCVDNIANVNDEDLRAVDIRNQSDVGASAIQRMPAALFSRFINIRLIVYVRVYLVAHI